MIDTDTADPIGRLEDRIVDLERRLAQYEKPSKQAPATDRYPDGHVTMSVPQHPAILPTSAELRRLEEIVYRAYPRLQAGGDPDSFRASFYRLTYTRRADKPDTKRDIDWWVDLAESTAVLSFETRNTVFRRRVYRNGRHRIYGPKPISERAPRDHRSSAIRTAAGPLAGLSGEQSGAAADCGQVGGDLSIAGLTRFCE
jgi:hypothetical protein